MGKETTIQYCHSTINPNPCCNGCELWTKAMQNKGDTTYCYAQKLQTRYAGRNGWPMTFDTPTHHIRRMNDALKWKDVTDAEIKNKPWLKGYPRIIFLNDTGDTFSPIVEIDWINENFSKIDKSDAIWMIFTKQVARLGQWLEYHRSEHSLHNCIFITSVTSRKTLWRAEELVKLYSRYRLWKIGLSLEPLIGRLHHSAYMFDRFDWVAIGGMSGGAEALSMDLNWVDEILEDAIPAYSSVFIKQMGANPTRGGISVLSSGTHGDDVSVWQDGYNIKEMFEEA